ncbi:MAG: hypothetical protein R3C99_03430 [Pirellulaceae bacterium]
MTSSNEPNSSSTARTALEAFFESPDAARLKSELDAKVQIQERDSARRALIENVNVRGRAIEYLIAGQDENVATIADRRTTREESNRIAAVQNRQQASDYTRMFKDFDTETDVKTKVLVLHSN